MSQNVLLDTMRWNGFSSSKKIMQRIILIMNYFINSEIIKRITDQQWLRDLFQHLLWCCCCVGNNWLQQTKHSFFKSGQTVAPQGYNRLLLQNQTFAEVEKEKYDKFIFVNNFIFLIIKYLASKKLILNCIYLKKIKINK